MSEPTYDPELGQQVLGLRRAGASFEQIADRLHLSAHVARSLFDRAMADYDPAVSAALEVDRLDRMHLAVWPQAVAGDLNAVDRILKISERRDRVTDDPTSNDHALEAAYEASVQSSTEVQDVDQALIAAGRRIAQRVDAAVASGDGTETTKALYLLPHMVNVLRELLATPASRNAAQEAAKPEHGGKLAQLRSVHEKRSSAG